VHNNNQKQKKKNFALVFSCCTAAFLLSIYCLSVDCFLYSTATAAATAVPEPMRERVPLLLKQQEIKS